ncbi:MAG TPA: hypothetical protein VK668_15900 [Mucilaginibacter sp.]|nr:hypothetical protein [Mucilaginibacter sp.]
MKKITLCSLMAVMLLIAATKVNAQTAPNYFVGKWDVLLKGTPNGDAHIKFNIADSVGHLKGTLRDTVENKDVAVTSIVQEGDKITLNFTIQSYDVNLTLAKKDEDHATGSLMGMFDAVADRIKK